MCDACVNAMKWINAHLNELDSIQFRFASILVCSVKIITYIQYMAFPVLINTSCGHAGWYLTTGGRLLLYVSLNAPYTPFTLQYVIVLMWVGKDIMHSVKAIEPFYN